MEGAAKKPELPALARVLEADAFCQGVIESSPSLAYAALRLRQGQAALAGRSLAAMAGDPEPKVREVAFFLGLQVLSDTGRWAQAKAELLPRLQADPANAFLAGLMQALVAAELEAAKEPAPAVAAAPGKGAAAPEPEAPAPAPASPLNGHGALPELRAYQAVLADFNTYALCLWGDGDLPRSQARDGHGGLAALLPGLLPGGLEARCRDLDGGAPKKICFCLEHATITTLHGPQGSLGLVTGPLPMSQLNIVRAERLFARSEGASAPAGEVAVK